MMRCDKCNGIGSIQAASSFGFPVKCFRCSGTGQIGLQHLCVGDHVCYLYKNRDDQMKTLVSFMAQGLRRNERCLWITDGHTPQEAAAALSAVGIRVQEESAKGAVTILTKHETYLKNGRFESKEMLSAWSRYAQETTQRGFQALRASGELDWALEPSRDLLDEIPAYESEVDRYFLEEKPRMLALCQYDAGKTPAVTFEKIRLAHRLALQD